MQTFKAGDTITPPIFSDPTIPGKFERKRGKVVPEKYSWFIILGLSALIGVWGYLQFSSGSIIGGVALLAFAATLFYISVIAFLRYYIGLQVASIMRKEAGKVHNEGYDTVPGTTEPAPPLIAPPFQLNVYEQNELDDPGYPLNNVVTAQKNIFNVAPYRILYFYNFFAADLEFSKVATMLDWRRHGAVYFLGSPKDIALAHTFSLRIGRVIKKSLITTRQKLEERLAKAGEQPIPPKTKGLMLNAFITGAYPEHLFLCTDGIWQEAVRKLFKKTDVALVDASDYNPERKGLIWEIGQITDHVATENFVVLINYNTDVPALGNEFRNAWKNMSPYSPNNRLNAGAVRFVLMQKPVQVDASQNAENRDEPKQVNTISGKQKPGMWQSMQDQILQKYQEETIANDRIFAMVMNNRK